MRAVGKTPNGFKSIRISSHTPKNIQEGSAEIICEDIDILSNPSHTPTETIENQTKSIRGFKQTVSHSHRIF